MFKFLENWKRRDEELFTANWQSIFANMYLNWVFLKDEIPTVDNITTEQHTRLNMAIEQNFLAFMCGAGVMWKEGYARLAHRSISQSLMDNTILGMSRAMKGSDDPAMILLGFVKVD